MRFGEGLWGVCDGLDWWVGVGEFVGKVRGEGSRRGKGFALFEKRNGGNTGRCFWMSGM